jgi:hypothetical protein
MYIYSNKYNQIEYIAIQYTAIQYIAIQFCWTDHHIPFNAHTARMAPYELGKVIL